ncbi:MAG: VRR-NUC domain-containing protein [Pseudomonadaceae bacterium]|nr:VRR-NUC domain-containing protein [Pseudomonadaceae bacterium]
MSKQLSINMLKALRGLHEAHALSKVSTAMVKALAARGLVDEDARLTTLGRITAIQSLPLKKQCNSIAITHSTLLWESTSHPEKYAHFWFAQQGYIGSYCEGGGFGAAIKALCLDELERNSIFYNTCIDAREDACLKGVVVLSHIEKSRLEGVFKRIVKTTKTEYLAAFSEIISYNMTQEWYPGLSLDFAEALFDAVPKEHFEKLAHWISTDHSHRNGWPDLTLIKDDRLRFVEVKTTDKLHHSQLVTIPALINEIGADISVLQLTHANNSRGMPQKAR